LPRYLNDEGVLVQWIQLYEIDFDLIASMLKALGNSFNDYDAYLSNSGDLIVVAKHKGFLSHKSGELLESPNLIAELKAQGLDTLGAANLRYLANKSLLDPLVQQTPIRANSDFYPIVSHLAPKTRFTRSTASALTELYQARVPYTEILTPNKALPKYTQEAKTRSSNVKVLDAMHTNQVAAVLMNEAEISKVTYKPFAARLSVLQLSKSTCHKLQPDELALSAMVDVGSAIATFLPSERAKSVLQSQWLGCNIVSTPAHFQLANELFLALAARDVDKIIQSGTAVLESPQLKSGTYISEIALCAIGVALVKKQNFNDASALFEKYKEVPFSIENRALRMILVALVAQKKDTKN
jgi:spermidine synthase